MNLFSNIDTYKDPKFMYIYSYGHLIFGTIAYFILHKILKYTLYKSFIIWLVLHTIYEIKDYYHTYIKEYTVRPNRSNKISGFFHSDNSLYNSIGDTVYTLIGFFIGVVIKDKLLQLMLLTIFSIYSIFMLKVHLTTN